MNTARQVVVADYDDAWPVQYEELRTLLAATLGDAVVAIEHVGSTAVPGLAAKPIIDIDVAVADYSSAHELRGPLEAAGFQRAVNGDFPDRQFYVREEDGRRTSHLSLTFLGGETWLSHQALLTRLRTDPDARREYAELKRRLATLNPTPEAYTDAKTEVIERLAGHGWRKGLPRPPLVSRRLLLAGSLGLLLVAGGIGGVAYYSETSRGADGLPDHRAVRAADLAGRPEAELFYPGSTVVNTARSDQSSDPTNLGAGPAKIDTLLVAQVTPDVVETWYGGALTQRGWSLSPNISGAANGEIDMQWRRGPREFFNVTLNLDRTTLGNVNVGPGLIYRVVYLVGTGR